jgi:hypothetical protein
MVLKILSRWVLIGAGLFLIGLLGWPAISSAQDVIGQASAVRATALGRTTILSDTGTLNGSTDAREASNLLGSVPLVLSGEALHATTIGYPDQVDSEASLGSLAMAVGGNGISADFVMARATSVLNGTDSYLTNIGGLRINGVYIYPSGAPNQTILIPGGRVVINEQISSAGATVVNALHVIINGVADVVIASAKAGVY